MENSYKIKTIRDKGVLQSVCSSGYFKIDINEIDFLSILVKKYKEIEIEHKLEMEKDLNINKLESIIKFSDDLNEVKVKTIKEYDK